MLVMSQARHVTLIPGAPATKRPIGAASANPSPRKIASTESTACGAHATSNPPEVCGSVSSARSRSPIPGASMTSLPYASKLRRGAPVTKPSPARSSTSGCRGILANSIAAPMRAPRMTVGHRNAGARANRFAAFENPLDHVERQQFDRHADDRQREEGCGAHRIDVGQRIRGGDRPEVERIVDDRHEEIRRRDDRLPLVQLVDRGIVGSLDAYEQRFRDKGPVEVAENALQHARRDLAAAAPAVRELGEANRRAFGGVHARRVAAAGHGTGATKGHSSAAMRRSSLANFAVVLQNIDVFQMLATPALFLLSGQA